MRKTKLDVSLTVTFLREGDQFVAYSPALDLSTSGDTLEQAKKRFDEAVNIFLEETTSKKTILDILAELGWGKSSNNWFPPVVVGQSSEIVKIPLAV